MTDTTRHDRTDTEPTAGGLLVVERGSAALGRLVDGRVDTVDTLDGQITGAARAGAGDPDRFERERERRSREFFHEVAAAAREAFLGDGPVARLAVGGPMDAATALVGGDYLDDRLTDRLVGTYTVEHASEPGLRQLLEAAGDQLLDAESRAVRDALDGFFERLRDGDRVAYGDDDLDRAVEYGAVDTALVSADLTAERRTEIVSAVVDQGGEVLIVPGDSERGARFAETFEVGALLRRPVN